MPRQSIPLGARVSFWILIAIIVLFIAVGAFCFTQPHEPRPHANAAPASAPVAVVGSRNPRAS